MAQNIGPRKKWHNGLPWWSTRLMVLLMFVGALIVVFDLALMANFALQASGLIGQDATATQTPTSVPDWTPTPTTTTPHVAPTATATQTTAPTATQTPTVSPLEPYTVLLLQVH